MKLTKKIEQEILNVYNTGWEAYMRGDLKTHASCLSSKFKIIGTTEAEHFNSKKAWLAFCKKTIHQVVGVVQMRNRKIRLEAVGDGVMVLENSAIYVLIDGTWQFYSKLRITALMRKEKAGWKYVHQHGSLPDTRASENETIATEKIKKENQQLREAVKRRTIELEEKNRELEIEAAVERVRAKAMGMHKSEEVLHVVVALKNELNRLALEVPITAATIFLKQADGSIRMWDITAPEAFNLSKNFDLIIQPKHEDPRLYFMQIWKSRGKYTMVRQDKSDLKRTVKWLRKHDAKSAKEIEKEIIRHKITSGFHPAVRLTHGWLCVDLNSPPPDELKPILQKMGAAFDLAYQRFLDLQKAEAQAREAQIEVALEKVRSRSLAMHKSEELKDVIKVVFDQLVQLNMPVEHAGFIIDYQVNKDMHIWLADPNRVPSRITIPYFDSPHWNSFLEAKAKRKNFFTNQLSFAEKNKFYKTLFKLFPIPEKTKKFYFNCPGLAISTTLLEDVGLYIENFSGTPYSEEENAVLMRFGKVFQQTYTRFLDLQKAEAQARESQIQLSLERVRSRAIAMHHSDEISDVLSVLFEQFDVLGISPMYTFLSLINVENNNFLYRQTGRGGRRVIAEQLIDMSAMDVWKDVVDRWKAANYDVVETMYVPKDLVPQVFDIYKEIYTALPEGAKVYPDDFPDGMHATIAASRFGHLGYDHFRPSTEEEKSILLRFNSEFVRVYQRFLDLQKAETQAREAQIEVAVERLRAKALAMHKSEEIIGVVRSLRQELENLQIPGVVSTTIYLKQEDGRIRFWDLTTIDELNAGDHTMDKYLRLEECPDFLWFQRMFRSNEKYMMVDQDKEELKKSMEWIRQNVSEEVAVSMTDFFEENNAWHLWHPRVLLENGLMNIDFIQTPPAEVEPILIKMGAAFDLAYKRFLDLQKAEAQAREAQIEAALERVRSRSLAMHKSDEIKEIVKEVFEQLKKLSFAIDGGVFIGIPEAASKTFNLWVGDDHAEYPTCFMLPCNEVSVVKDIWNATDAGLEFVSKVYNKEEKNNWFAYAFAHTDFKTLPDQLKEWIINQDYLTQTFALAKYSGIGIHFHHQRTLLASEVDILKRFSKVFEQGYVRFLDLQKAEAQAREAQIEAALEKVRSRAMAMQKSDELLQVIKTLSEQLRHLGLRAEAVSFLTDGDERGYNMWLSSPGEDFLSKIFVPRIQDRTTLLFLEAKESGKRYYSYVLSKEEKDIYFQNFFDNTVLRDYPDNGKEQVYAAPGMTTTNVLLDSIILSVSNFDTLPFSDQENEIINRIAFVFQQTYTRFLDLQKAEAQAREAQIEAALERVRAQTMAMHNSEDVGKCVVKMFSELTSLGVDEGTRFGIGILNHDNENNQLWTARKDGEEVNMHIGNIDMTSHPLLKSARNAWKEQVPLHKYVLEGEDLLDYYQMLNNAPDYKIQIPIEKLPKKEIQHCFIFEYGFFYAFTPREFQPELIHITQRFSALFEQTYRRYLDLVRAEAQAREARIEAALERVRTRAMAMHVSNELEEVAHELRTQIGLLGANEQLETCAINLYDESEENVLAWGATRLPDSNNEIVDYNFYVPKVGIELIEKILRAYMSNMEEYLLRLDGPDMVQWLNVLKQVKPDLFSIVDEAVNFTSTGQHTAWFSCAFFPGGTLVMITFSEPDNQSRILLRRFSQVFGLAYRRFADLKQAEAQAREAQIEAALEKVRSRSLAMHTSSELNEVVKVLFEKLTELQVPSTAVGIQTFIEGSNDMQAFVCGDVGTGIVINQYRLPYFDHPIVHDYLNAHKNKLEVFVGNYSKKVKDSFYDVIVKLPELKDLEAEVKTMIYNSDFYEVTIVPAEKSLIAVNDFQGNPLAESQVNILKRFAKVFDQTYTRFLDLQKAEVQAREAKIEAALERVRAQAMAMHHSEDLGKTIRVYFEQLDDLIDSAIVRCGAGLLNKENTIAEMSTASKSSEGETYSVKGRIDMRGHPMLESAYEYWLQQKEYNTVLRGNEIREYYQYITGQVAIAENRGEDELHFYFPMFTEGSFYVVTNTEVPEVELRIFRRFSSVLSLTYRRFNDLQKAEEQAREAIKQSSLDRIRGEIASMRTANDLERITPLIWKELTTLNIPFTRCGVFIMDDQLQQIHTFLSTPDGKAIAAFHLPYDAPGRTSEIVGSWLNKQAYIEHWDETAFSELGDLLVQQGALPSKAVYLKTVPSGGLYLHCLPFMQGMLYVGNTVKLNEDEIQLIQSVAETFATAYARYEDFNKLEAAKQQVDKALVELKQTQQQLIQSEKMASLGELTAGIAHEIQNPLNFVNNFSEVSNELLDEMKEEINKGNYDEVKAITDDVKQNLEKILHHGKRADGIVKGMLQHSRSSSGTKEPTDINALADEYLRLAYHGLRAKDKSFNAKLETQFDESIEKVEMVPQDIGRVILNLITNAFYVVAEKKKSLDQSGFKNLTGLEPYEPTVTVSTRRSGSNVLISVKDNGNGIPENIKEKIFQPFFTTKPTGQGTGLGLSLSYDIVKANGGELRVETKEGEGSEFIIQLTV